MEKRLMDTTTIVKKFFEWDEKKHGDEQSHHADAAIAEIVRLLNLKTNGRKTLIVPPGAIS